MRHYAFQFVKIGPNPSVRTMIMSASNYSAAKSSAVRSAEDGEVFAGFYRLPFNPKDRLSVTEVERMLAMLPFIRRVDDADYAISEAYEDPATLLDVPPEKEVIEPLYAKVVGEGYGLPVYNIKPESHDGAIVLAFTALLRHLREYHEGETGAYVNNLGTHEIMVASHQDHDYGLMKTSVYTVIDGKRHGLSVQTPIVATGI
jgi:hypothetical protein